MLVPVYTDVSRQMIQPLNTIFSFSPPVYDKTMNNEDGEIPVNMSHNYWQQENCCLTAALIPVHNLLVQPQGNTFQFW